MNVKLTIISANANGICRVGIFKVKRNPLTGMPRITQTVLDKIGK